jgi:hypothetical protein
MADSGTSGGGVGFFGLLTILFIALKLTDYISWSWVWVLAPTWIPLALGCILFVLAGAAGAAWSR